MRAFLLTHLTDAALRRDLAAHVVRERANTAMLVALIAEFDSRGLFLAAGYASMFAYCVEELHMSEDAACTRIHAARVARQFPSLLEELESGRLHLTAVRLLGPHLTPENAEALVAAATHRGKSEIERWLAQRSMAAQAPPRVVQAIRAIPTRSVGASVPERIDPSFPGLNEANGADGQLECTPSAPAPTPSSSVRPPETERYFLQLVMGKATHDKLRRAQVLLSHSIPSGSIEQVLDRALDLLITHLEKRKFAAAERPRPEAPPSARKRHIPAHVRRAVWERDQGRCTFVSADGHRCAANKLLEYDHVDPVARGGKATVERMRLRCRGHNQYEAERTFGAAFMDEKRKLSRQAKAGKGAREAAISEAIDKERTRETACVTHAP